MDVRVASASFFRLECGHDTLFKHEYKRSNRTKGLKILRCFPHCCPEHIDRSYCGSSLSVQVQLERAPHVAKQRDALAVFARFEAVSDVSLRPGDCVEVDKIHRGVQTETNLEGQWIAGLQDRPSGLVASIRSAESSSQEDKALVFHLNGKSFSRWYYDWESGANKAQRLMKHVLKAYVVQRCAVDMDNNFTTASSGEALTQLYRVLHVVSSPEFTVISYRRAPLEQIQAAQAAVLAKTNALPRKTPVKMPSSRVMPAHMKRPMALQDRAYERNPFVDPRVGTVLSDPRSQDVEVWEMAQQTGAMEPDGKRRRRLPPGRPGKEILVHPLENQLFWEHSNAPAVAVSKNLALLYAFLGWTPLGLYSAFVDELMNSVEHQLLDPMSAIPMEADKRNCFTQMLLQHCTEHDARTAAEGGAAAALPRELETLLRVASQALLWLYSKETHQWIRTFFRLHAHSVVDKPALRACFLLFLQELEERLNAQVFAATELRTLSIVAEEVIAAVYSYTHFHSKRPRVRQILSGQSFAGWNAFVAQMRDAFISSTGLPRPLHASTKDPTFMMAYRPHNAVESTWNGAWLLDMEHTKWKSTIVSPSTDSKKGFTEPDVSLLSVFEIIAQLVRLEVALDMEGATLLLRSTQNLAGLLDCMHVVLDGKDRVFRLFPNGLASACADGSCGDYVGEMCIEEKKHLVVYLELFKWALQPESPAYHVRTRIECQQNGRLIVDGDVLETMAPSLLTAEEVSYLAEMPLRAKRALIEKASRRRASPSAQDRMPTAAWGEHSRFQLIYNKM